MPRYKAAFEDDTLVLPRDADILADHRMIKVIDGVGQIPRAERRKGADGAKRHGDSAIAGCLACYATTMDIAVYEYTSGALPPVTDDDHARQDGLDRQVKCTGGFKTQRGMW
jgi:phage FluMu gp28-like protein